MKRNQTAVTEFILLGFPKILRIEVSLFVLFFIFYTVTVCGNVIVMFLVWLDIRLKTPMYFFLACFAFMEIILSRTVTPNVLRNLMSTKKTISFIACLVQSYCFFLLGTANFILLAGMSYDRYIAICHPLQYASIMRWKRCIFIVAGSWLGSFLSVSIGSFFKVNLPFCGPNTINHFFCDSAPLLQLVCADTSFIQMLDFFLFSLIILGTLIVIIFTYTCILLTVFRIPSVSGRQKTFSTCASHFTIMTTVYASSIFLYVTPRHGNLLEVNKTMSAIVIFIIPVLNPFILTLRNKQVKDVISDAIKRYRKYRK